MFTKWPTQVRSHLLVPNVTKHSTILWVLQENLKSLHWRNRLLFERKTNLEIQWFNNTNLKTHERIHTGEEPFACSKCDKLFTQIVNLKKHERTHTGEKPFACSQCDKAFAQIGTLKRHKNTHTGEKPFACPKCVKTFTESGSLKKHEKIHTGEKPFACSKCDTAFNRRDSLKLHERTHPHRRKAIYLLKMWQGIYRL